MISITRMKPKNFHTIYLQNPPKLPHTQIPKSNTWWSIGSKIIYDLQNQAKNGARKIKEKKKQIWQFKQTRLNQTPFKFGKKKNLKIPNTNQ